MMNITDYYKSILDKWLKLKSYSWIQERKKEGAKISYREEHLCRRSYEMGIMEGFKKAAETSQRYKIYLSQMQEELKKIDNINL